MQSTENKAKHCWITSLFYPDRSGMNEMNKFLSMSMMRNEKKGCEDTISTKKCLRVKKTGKCCSKKYAKRCKKTCELCQGRFTRVNPSWSFYKPSSTSFGLSQTS